MIGLPPLRPYQQEAARAVLASVDANDGATLTIEIARQGGKNELAARIEAALLLRRALTGGEIIKCAPTRRPQLDVSMRRLRRALDGAARPLTREHADAFEVGRARIHFLSAARHANVVGHTASLLLAADEAQQIDAEKFDRDFRPMAAAHNATTVLYGTTWDDRALIERVRQANEEAARRGRPVRSFRFPWQTVAHYVPGYAAYVGAERERLGERHPLFLTQYCLEPLPGAGRLFNRNDLRALQGNHGRMRGPAAGERYVAGLDIAGGDDAGAVGAPAGRDSTVLTVARLGEPGEGDVTGEPRAEIVELAEWTGVPHERLLAQAADALALWRVERVAIDATGIGETIARIIAVRLGEARVEAIKFTRESKSRIGFELLAAVQTGRVKLFASDGSDEARRFREQAERARVAWRPDGTMSFFVDPAEGHDDYLVSLALLVHAARGRQRRAASGRIRPPGFLG